MPVKMWLKDHANLLTSEEKMQVIRRLEGGQSRPICRDINTTPSTVTIILKNADKIKKKMETATLRYRIL
jgi:hypothetical protein